MFQTPSPPRDDGTAVPGSLSPLSPSLLAPLPMALRMTLPGKAGIRIEINEDPDEAAHFTTLPSERAFVLDVPAHDTLSIVRRMNRALLEPQHAVTARHPDHASFNVEPFVGEDIDGEWRVLVDYDSPTLDHHGLITLRDAGVFERSADGGGATHFRRVMDVFVDGSWVRVWNDTLHDRVTALLRGDTGAPPADETEHAEVVRAVNEAIGRCQPYRIIVYTVEMPTSLALTEMRATGRRQYGQAITPGLPGYDQVVSVATPPAYRRRVTPGTVGNKRTTQSTPTSPPPSYGASVGGGGDGGGGRRNVRARRRLDMT